MNRSPKRIILGILIVLTLAVVYVTASHRWPNRSGNGKAASQGTSSERRPIYWYDAMNPQHHYNQPGKAPDGMDLVPQYAKQTNSSPSADMAKALQLALGALVANQVVPELVEI